MGLSQQPTGRNVQHVGATFNPPRLCRLSNSHSLGSSEMHPPPMQHHDLSNNDSHPAYAFPRLLGSFHTLLPPASLSRCFITHHRLQEFKVEETNYIGSEVGRSRQNANIGIHRQGYCRGSQYRCNFSRAGRRWHPTPVPGCPRLGH